MYFFVHNVAKQISVRVKETRTHKHTQLWHDVRERNQSDTLTQNLDGLPVWPLTGQSTGALQIIFAFPQLAPNGAVEEDEAKHRAEKVGGGHPEHDVQLPRADGVAGVLALLPSTVVRVCVIVVLHSNQEECGSCRNQGEPPQGEDDVLDPAFGHQNLAPEGEADGQVALDAQGRDVKDGGRGAALKDVVIEPAHRLPKQPGNVLPQAVEVKGQAEEDDEVRHRHAGQVEVGGGFHVLEMLDDEDGHGVACHANDEDEDADDSDRDEGGCWEEGPLVVMVVHVVSDRGLRSTSMKVHWRAGWGHSNLH